MYDPGGCGLPRAHDQFWGSGLHAYDGSMDMGINTMLS